MIDTAIIPAAGLGKRMQHLTSTYPKELLPIGNMSLIEYSLIELLESGINRVGIVIRKDKEIVKQYLDGRKNNFAGLNIEYIYQGSLLGVGDALYSAKDFIDNRPFIMIIPDQILISKIPASRQVIDHFNKTNSICNSIVRLGMLRRRYFKGSRKYIVKKDKNDLLRVLGLKTDNNSFLRGFGRTVFLPKALDFMTKEYINPESQEIDLGLSYQMFFKEFLMYGMYLQGIPCDLGTIEGYFFYSDWIKKYNKLKGSIYENRYTSAGIPPVAGFF